MSKEKRRVPKLRFPGFTEDWEQRKLGEFVKIVSGDAPSTFISGNCIYVKVDDLNYSDRIQLSSSNLVNANSKAHLVNQGATIFPKRGAAIMTNKVRIMGKDGYLDTNMMALIPEEIDKDFLFTFIQKTGLYKIADTSTIPQINNKHIEPYMIQVPSEKEQAYIGVVFKKIDKIITLHQRKLEHLNLKKKALLQKLFPKNGERYPELRFPGFTDAWEQRKLSEFVDKAVDNRGKTPPLDENGAHPLIEVAALGGVYPDYSKVEKYLSDDVFNTNLRAYIKKDDILFTTVGSIGLVSLMDSREEAAIAQNIVAFRAKENFLPEYLYALFSNEDNQYKAKRIAMVAVQPSIKVSQLVNVEYMISTNIEEQERIGVFFSSLQSLITLHQQEPFLCGNSVIDGVKLC